MGDEISHVKVSPGGHAAPEGEEAGRRDREKWGAVWGAVRWSPRLQEIGLVGHAGVVQGAHTLQALFLMACNFPLDSARKGCFWKLGRKLIQ